MKIADVVALICLFGSLGIVAFGFVLYQLGTLVGKVDLVLRKLNNQQPDNEGGY